MSEKFEVNEGGWQQEKQNIIMHYSENELRLQEEIKNLRDELTYLR